MQYLFSLYVDFLIFSFFPFFFSLHFNVKSCANLNMAFDGSNLHLVEISRAE